MPIFLPIADTIRSGADLLYNGTVGTGGMRTVVEETLIELATERGHQITTHLYGQEMNPETYATCKADMLLKGEGENADHIVGGAEWSTHSRDAFAAMEFDVMMSNPPYGKSWKKDLEQMGGRDGMCDPPPATSPEALEPEAAPDAEKPAEFEEEPTPFDGVP